MKKLTKDSLSGCFRFTVVRRWLRGALSVLLALGALQIVLASSKGSVELISVNNQGADSGNESSIIPLVSANGRFVVFGSSANDLVSMDTNGQTDVFARDLKTGATSLVSVNKLGTDSGNGSSSAFMISADGRFVVFQSDASDLVPTDTNGKTDVFLRDLQNGTTTLISVNKDGTDSGNDLSFLPVMSTNGQFVVFSSYADDLIDMDTNGIGDLFVRDLRSGTTTQIVVFNDESVIGVDIGLHYMMSADGRFVVFDSDADSLVDTDTNGDWDVFVWDSQGGTTNLVSVNKEGTGSGNGSSYPSSVSADGRFVAFGSYASDLVDTDTNGVEDVFVRDLQNGVTTLVSVNRQGTDSGNGSWSFNPLISADGRFVAFGSNADDLVATDTNGWEDVFVRDLQNGTTALVSVNRDGADSGNNQSYPKVISADGRFVVFDSIADNLVHMDAMCGYFDVFVRDLQRENTILVSVSKDGTCGNNSSRSFSISADNRRIFFDSNASNLVATDSNDTLDVFVFELSEASLSCNCNAHGAIKGTSSADFLYGTEQADIICGFGGDDLIFGLDGDDCIDGGEDKDWIDGGRGDDLIFGGAGKDLVYGGRGNDRISGDEDEDFLFGGAGDDRLDGAEGYDWVFCGRGTDEGVGEHVRGCER
ncbi:MAG: calcium-binding protein [Candidatus Thiodiazotropha sp.]